jgi:hypothetical protein
MLPYKNIAIVWQFANTTLKICNSNHTLFVFFKTGKNIHSRCTQEFLIGVHEIGSLKMSDLHGNWNISTILLNLNYTISSFTKICSAGLKVWHANSICPPRNCEPAEKSCRCTAVVYIHTKKYMLTIAKLVRINNNVSDKYTLLLLALDCFQNRIPAHTLTSNISKQTNK